MTNNSEYTRPKWFKPNARYDVFARLRAWVDGTDDGDSNPEIMVLVTAKTVEVLGETYDYDDDRTCVEVLAELPVATFQRAGMVLVSRVCNGGNHTICDLVDQADCGCKCHGINAGFYGPSGGEA